MLPYRIKVEVTSADITGLIQELTNYGITAFDFLQSGDLCVMFSVKEHDLPVLEKLINKRADSIRIIRRSIYWHVLRSISRRFVLILGTAVLLAIALYLPTRVLFIQVEGNHTIPTQLLIQEAEECGIRLGASRKLVRSEMVKNGLLNRIPELQWVGVNTHGCVAVISVEERTQEYSLERQTGVSSIIACHDGIITDLTVRSGDPKCQIGQGVQKGQILVSGYTDCGLKVQIAPADAEILAQTIRKVDVIMPANCVQRVSRLHEKRKYMLLVGKKLINLQNGSGICDSSCAKIYSRKYMELPGGFRLPIALITVKYVYHSSNVISVSQKQGNALLETSARNELKNQMTGGRILQEDTVMIDGAGYYRLVGEYICSEMIGKIVQEESFYIHGENH